MNSSVSIALGGTVSAFGVADEPREVGVGELLRLDQVMQVGGAELWPIALRSYGSRMRSISSAAMPWLFGGSSHTR